MLVLIGALIIVIGAFAVAAIDGFVYNRPLAIVLQIFLLAAGNLYLSMAAVMLLSGVTRSAFGAFCVNDPPRPRTAGRLSRIGAVFCDR